MKNDQQYFFYSPLIISHIINFNGKNESFRLFKISMNKNSLMFFLFRI